MAPTYPISRFHFFAKDNQLVAEMSDLGRNFGGQIWNDSADYGFRVKGARQTAVYVLVRQEKSPDGELIAERYTAHTERGSMLEGLPEVLLFND